jgi:aminoglycoside 6'-N-acetyltransferase I
MHWTIREATPLDAAALAAMFAALWPRHPAAELEELARARTSTAAAAPVFVAQDNDLRLVAFVYLDLRTYAEGCETSPVPFVEGWWVAPAWRGRGVGGSLIARAEEWSRERGYHEIASDTELSNVTGQAAHRALGFVAEPPLVPFRKRL